MQKIDFNQLTVAPQKSRAIPDEFITTLQGKQFVLYGGLLHLAHQDGLTSVHTEILQFPNDDNANCCIIRATVQTTKGTFTGIGDASPSNVNRMIAAHLIRMSETRAIARALRVATNVSMTALEELGGDDHFEPPKKQINRSNDKQINRSEEAGSGGATQKQKSYLWKLAQMQGWDQEELASFVETLVDEKLENMSQKGASKAIDQLNQLSDQKIVAEFNKRGA